MISGTNNYNENLTYDLRGNIQTLQRTGFYQNGGTCTYGQIDNLTYSYSPNTNRLHKVLDGTTTAGDAKSRGFNGSLSTADGSMDYDRNGNLNKNLHKNVSTITYNHLNLPTVITFTTGNTIEFLYDAAGMKLRKTVKVGATVQYIQDYLSGGVEYRQNGTGVKRVEAVNHAEGRYYNTNVDASNTISWRREYNIKDHLGNTRLVFTDRNANGVVDITGTASTSDILQENHYYSFGLGFEGAWLMNDAVVRDNYYQYNGKEWHNDFGMNLYAYGARYYDPTIGRFTGVDPIADKFPFVTTFNYAENEPIANIDLHGLQKYKATTNNLQGGSDLLSTKMINKFSESLVKTGKALAQATEKLANFINDKVIGNDDIGNGIALTSAITEGASEGALKKISDASNFAGPAFDAAEGLQIFLQTDKNDPKSMEQSIQKGAKLVTEVAAGASLGPATSIAVNGVIRNSMKKDGLTNLSNGRMSRAYSSSYDQTNAYVRRTFMGEVKKNAAEPEKKAPKGNTQIKYVNSIFEAWGARPGN